MPAAAPVREGPVAFSSVVAAADAAAAAAVGPLNAHEAAYVAGLDDVAASIEAASRGRASAVFLDVADDRSAGIDLDGRSDCTSKDSACMHIHHFAAQEAAEVWHAAAAPGSNCHDGYDSSRLDASATAGCRVASEEGRCGSGEMRKARG